MQISIDVPDWLVKDYEARKGTKLDKSVAETAVRAYYMRQFDPMYNQKLSGETLVALYGDDSSCYLDQPSSGDFESVGSSTDEGMDCSYSS